MSDKQTSKDEIAYLKAVDELHRILGELYKKEVSSRE